MEKNIDKFLTSLKGDEETPWDEETQRLGAKNVGVIVQNPKTGEILAMADSRSYDPNNPRDLKNYYSSDQIRAMSEQDQIEALNDIWKNYCVTDAYEPGSTTKPLTLAGALEAGIVYDGEEFLCDGNRRMPAPIFTVIIPEDTAWRRPGCDPGFLQQYADAGGGADGCGRAGQDSGRV